MSLTSCVVRGRRTVDALPLYLPIQSVLYGERSSLLHEAGGRVERMEEAGSIREKCTKSSSRTGLSCLERRDAVVV